MSENETPAVRCEMYHEEPFDFACCETHDEVFALGSVCPFFKKPLNDV